MQDERVGHATLMSVMFGVALGFWVATIRFVEPLPWQVAATLGLTFLVIGCIWWWYVNLGSAFPSHSLMDYYFDFAIVGGLCLMSASAGTSPSAPLKWTLAWATVALASALKAWLRTDPRAKPEYKKMLDWARGATTVIFLVSGYAVSIAVNVEAYDEAPLRFWLATWVPVVAGILITFYVARHLRPARATPALQVQERT